MAVNIRIGTGRFDDFNIMIDTNWNAVPRAGETIVLDPREGAADVYNVVGVRYVVGPDENLTGAMVLVTKEPKVTADSIKAMVG